MSNAAQPAWIKALVATGQPSLTLYVAHVVVGMGLLEAFDRLENQSLVFASWTASLFTLAGVVFSWAWRSRFKRGPLKQVMRWVTG